MSMLLLGYVLGALPAILHHYFVVKPALERAMVDLLELRRFVAELENND